MEYILQVLTLHVGKFLAKTASWEQGFAFDSYVFTWNSRYFNGKKKHKLKESCNKRNKQKPPRISRAKHCPM